VVVGLVEKADRVHKIPYQQTVELNKAPFDKKMMMASRQTVLLLHGMKRRQNGVLRGFRSDLLATLIPWSAFQSFLLIFVVAFGYDYI
jgi:hypothetical protein